MPGMAGERDRGKIRVQSQGQHNKAAQTVQDPMERDDSSGLGL